MGAAQSDVLDVSGCPPITLTTYTVSNVEVISVNTEVVTSYMPLPSDTTVTSTLTTESTLVIGPYASSSVAGTITKTSISVISAETTITEPTPCGFTPVHCNANYYNPVVTTNYSTSTDTAPSTQLIFTSDPAALYVYVSTVTEYTATTTKVNDYTFVVPTFATTTETITRDDPTSTVYEACATNNVVADLPGGVYFYQVKPLSNDTDSPPNSVTALIPAVDAVDCCAQCQANETCVGSSYSLTADPVANPCTLFIKYAQLDQTCDPGFIGAYDYNIIGTPTTFISNSGCGQILL